MLNSKLDIAEKTAFMTLTTPIIIWSKINLNRIIWGEEFAPQNIFGLLGKHNADTFDIIGFDAGKYKFYFTRYNSTTDTFSLTGYFEGTLI